MDMYVLFCLKFIILKLFIFQNIKQKDQIKCKLTI